MAGPQPLTPATPSAYEAIAVTMAESATGRWFLAEHARRSRADDTRALLSSMARLEAAVGVSASPEGLGHLRGDLREMAEAIARTKAEIAAICAPGREGTSLSRATESLDAILRATESATSDILAAAEDVQETAWALRETGAEPGVCDALDGYATRIYTACSFQDLTAQRTGRIVHTLRYLEDRIAAMIDIWGVTTACSPVPQPEAEGGADADLCQSDIDRYIAQGADAATECEASRAPVRVEVPGDVVFLPVAGSPGCGGSGEESVVGDDAADGEAARERAADAPFADIDALALDERLALFS